MFCLSADRFELAFNVLTAVVISDSNNSAIQKSSVSNPCGFVIKERLFQKAWLSN